VPLALSSLQREPKLPHLSVAVSAALEESLAKISDSLAANKSRNKALTSPPKTVSQVSVYLDASGMNARNRLSSVSG
jgi:hypothetical protein